MRILKLSLLTLIFLLTGFLVFYKLGEAEFVRWDEYTNYQVVDDTINSNNPLILKYDDASNGLFFEKPPLWYWLAIGLVKIFGINSFVLRSISALSGFLFIIFLFLIGRKGSSYWGGVTTVLVILGSSHILFSPAHIFSTHNFRSADLDAMQLLFIILVMLVLTIHENSSEGVQKKRNLIPLASIFTAIAFLVKGPFALFPFLLWGLYRVINIFRSGNKIELIKKTNVENIYYLLVFLIIIVPWHLFMYQKFGGLFVNEYFEYHLIRRVVSPLEGHSANNFMHIIQLLDIKLFFSGILYFFSVGYLFIRYKLEVLYNFKIFFPLVGSIVSLLIISLIKTQLAWYIFYFYPFAALLMGQTFIVLCKDVNNYIDVKSGVLWLIFNTILLFSLLMFGGELCSLIIVQVLVLIFSFFLVQKNKITLAVVIPIIFLSIFQVGRNIFFIANI